MKLEKKDISDDGKWNSEDKMELMKLLKNGDSISEISNKLSKSLDDIFNEMKMLMTIKIEDGDKLLTASSSGRAIANAARRVARANGKRITMSIFYVEDL